VPVTEAIGDAPNVVGVVYLAALMLDSGESVFSSAGMVEPVSLSGALPVVSEPHAAYFADLSLDRANWAVSQLVPQSVRSFGERLTRAGWRDIASALHRMYARPCAVVRAAAGIRVPSGHGQTDRKRPLAVPFDPA
jgi:hypothetical protein